MTARLHSLRHQEKKSAVGSSNNSNSNSSSSSSSNSSNSNSGGGSASSHRHQQQAAVHQGLSPAPSPTPAPSPSLSPSPKLSDGRRANKPLMEKRRRARINQSLAALKALILDSARLENTKHSKLEKADILELTVRHLQRQRSLAQPGLSRYKAGYQDCSREVSRYLDAPDIITGNTTPMDPAVKQRLLRHLDSCVSELDLDLGSRPDSGLGSSPGSVTDRVAGASSPGPLLDHHVSGPTHCSAPMNPALIKAEITEMETARPDSSTTAGDENNNSSRPTSAFSQMNPASLDPHHPASAAAAAAAAAVAAVTGGLPVEQASTSQQNPNMLSVVQVIPSRLPDGQVVFLLPSHYVQLAAAAAANGISIGPNPPTAIWAATNMSLLKATDKLVKRPHEDLQEWQDATAAAVKCNKSPRIEQPEQPLDFTTTSKKLKTAARNSIHAVTASLELQQHLELPPTRTPTDGGGAIMHEERPSSHAGSELAVGTPSPSPVGHQPVKDEEGMWRPW